MCGIAGIYSTGRISKIEERIDRMNNSILHRGPDAGAHYVSENKIALGHRRLSIIDTREIANQPMHTKSDRWHIVFNGEIYNFQGIRECLNYEFITNSDTEVIIAAVEEKGIDWFLDRANGMFSIALYNSLEKKLFLVRDRLGIKPLFYYNDGQNMVFSSEIKAILSSGLVKAEFNDSAVDEYLANRYVRSPYTFFKKIFQVEPGSYLEVNNELLSTQKKFWDIPKEFNTSKDYNEDHVLEGFEKELVKAIKYRLISDVPLGTYLSGGVDSSLITAITALNKDEKVNTYTIGFNELNEFKYSELIAEQYKTNHHEILMKKEDYLAKWEQLIKFKDSPLGVPNEIPLAVMSSKLKEKITVVLSGEGADELLGGYGRIFRKPFEYENSKKETEFYNYFIHNYEYVPRSMRDKLINTSVEYRDEFDSKIKKEFKSRSNEENVFNFFHKYHVKGLLQRVDMTTMQTSVEARVPFLDHNLIEYAYKNIPYDLKLKWLDEESKEKAKELNSNDYSEELDIPKYILRELSYKYLPKEIIERKKVGFPVPLNEWFDNLDILARDLLENVDWLKPNVLDNLIDRSKKEPRAGQILWMFINIELFKKNYFNKDWRWN
ncbi:asparagine synthase (glutamine-hydrolyzing) [Aquimarina gracilis]|uniref:asparagine synthase (glutamine-hydrolyzing) n=1 Tax=Aquimarina gracilis TaxID=874422 RepID=A0ABU6A0V1_9FLAO|nr:asparagine synthase (glutamine-hydrolyzing) [Aquimarina gracilis]MEB3347747.1 asparagine synthase (glutamine-hydrolyzing) [Aquimarina gracilis]